MEVAQLGADLAAAFLAVSGVPAAAHPHVDATPLFAFADPQVAESSGLLAEGRTVLTNNDSGDGPVIYAVDARTGRTVGHTVYSPDPVVDVEAIAQAPDGSVWAGDIGDNGATRSSIAIYHLPPVQRGDRTVAATRYDLRYVGGPHDAETLLADPRDGRLYVVTKGLFGGQVFAAPQRLSTQRTNRLRPVGRADGLVTDGAFFPDGRHVLLRTYSIAVVYDTRHWRPHARMTLPAQPQGEGLAMTPGGRAVLVSSEGRGTPVWRVPLTPSVLRAVRPRATPTPTPAAAPATRSTPAGGDAGPGRGLVLGGGAALVLVSAAALGLRAVRRRNRCTR